MKPGLKLVTCGLPYANGKAHIGHLRTYVPADVYVRYLKMLGEDVIFICGSDCHGTPIVVNAEKEGISPRELVDRYHDHFQKVFKAIDIEFDFFGRTDSEYHHIRTQEFVKKLIENGYIFPKEIELAYCPKCQRFLPDRYVEGICPYCGSVARGDECDQGCGRHLEPGEIKEPKCKICGSNAVFRKQKHYFFRLTAFKDFLLDYLENLRGTENALNYAKQWVKGELKDWCITRNLEWGVKFPGEDLVVYVWVDAPIGYISFTEKACEGRCDWKDIWINGKAEIIHFIGLDIVYHHCIFWPAMLKGAGYALPNAVVASGMVKVEGKTFSKSRGYVVWVEDDYLKAGFNTDYLRYYIVNYTSHQRDLNFSWEVFRDKVNNELIATLGNFLYRVMHFAWKNFGSVEVSEVDEEIMQKIAETKDKIVRALEEWEFKVASDAFMELAGFGNVYFQNVKPWELIKENKEECIKVIANCLQLAKALIIFSYPVMPRTMEKMGRCIGLDVRNAKLEDALSLLGKTELEKPDVPFEKIDDKKIEEMEKLMMERIRRAEMAEKGAKEEKEIIDIEEFKRLDIRIGRIVKAERIKGAKKLLRLEVDIGGEVRQLVAGIAEVYEPEDVVGKLVPILVNLKPAKIRGVESQGMMLAADIDGKPVLLHPDKDVPPGSKIR
ncbi:methionine--tRNA ligase [Archaeoglobus veneficus]|uniref:Methionine--tRNA ligase n=1 Tax=Archaeoglobus veneficus (strain DSM 11195 / SNP6) TaxID=693661 RepID=F2KQW4_ARCVS|nr:methionine--tRNA ligase [Archaeoglobus veneficus]AEA47770.1 Methionyl-tRNA synthetase [Archaeoglobus veneficus SNP6]